MTTSVSFPLRQSNPEALDYSQQASQFLQKYASTGTSKALVPFWSYPESTEIWLTHERLLLSCLRTGDNKSAFLALERLIDRFGATNERVMGLRGMYQEAVAEDDNALEKILKEYNDVLAENPVNTPVAKRRIALLQGLSRTLDAIDALTKLLESSPTDIEAWTELADLYLNQGLYDQAIFCLEEVLLVAPNAWNIHARLGEVLYMVATGDSESAAGRTFAEAMRRFCRSIELCDDYLRGYYGLKMTSDRLLAILLENGNYNGSVVATDDAELSMPPTAIVQRLNEKATSKLAEITRQRGRDGHDLAEVIAAKNLLDKSTQSRER